MGLAAHNARRRREKAEKTEPVKAEESKPARKTKAEHPEA